MRIYIRHADKEYANRKFGRFKHDPGLTENGANKAYNVAEEIVKLYGVPKLIISSPFKRTRDTSTIIRNVTTEHSSERIPIIVDENISEFLGHQRKIKRDVRPETNMYNLPPHPETMEAFSERIQKHNTDARLLDSMDDVYLFVTHGIVMKYIAKEYDINISDVPSLGFMTITLANQQRNILTSWN